MKIFGHPWIASECFVVVDSLEKIQSSPAGSLLVFDDLATSIEWVHYCQKEGLPFAVRVAQVKTALFAHALGARYLIVDKEVAQEVQQMAQQYLFDTQILVEIRDEDEIESYARMGLDGVLLPAAIR